MGFQQLALRESGSSPQQLNYALGQFRGYRSKRTTHCEWTACVPWKLTAAQTGLAAFGIAAVEASHTAVKKNRRFCLALHAQA